MDHVFRAVEDLAPVVHDEQGGQPDRAGEDREQERPVRLHPVDDVGERVLHMLPVVLDEQDRPADRAGQDREDQLPVGFYEPERVIESLEHDVIHFRGPPDSR